MARTKKPRRRTQGRKTSRPKTRRMKPVRRRAKARAKAKARSVKRAASRSKRTKATARRARPTARKRAKAPARRAKTGRKATAKKATRRAAPRPLAPAKAQRIPASPRPRVTVRPPLDRNRRVLSDDERLSTSSSSLIPRDDDRLTSSARAGHDELRSELRLHTESGPELTAGDVDAKWQDAYAVGDEAPGGDNPTPDQDRVDDIGRALGIEYQDNQELQGGDEIRERDRHRWEK